jgi:hypothetical protein
LRWIKLIGGKQDYAKSRIAGRLTSASRYIVPPFIARDDVCARVGR